MKTQKSAERVAVEAVLQCSSAKWPLTAEEISERSGVSLGLTRRHIEHCTRSGMAYNLHPRQRGAALYAWGKPATEARTAVGRYVPSGSYTGPPPIVMRERSQDAFDLPSREGDYIKPRTLPISNSCYAEQIGRVI